jgi:hypothetical protein
VLHGQREPVRCHDLSGIGCGSGSLPVTANSLGPALRLECPGWLGKLSVLVHDVKTLIDLLKLQERVDTTTCIRIIRDTYANWSVSFSPTCSVVAGSENLTFGHRPITAQYKFAVKHHSSRSAATSAFFF